MKNKNITPLKQEKLDFLRKRFVGIVTSEDCKFPELTNEELAKTMIDEVYDNFKRWGFCYRDISGADLSKISQEVMSDITFSSSTIWPSKDKLPKGFNPAEIIEQRRTPALGIKALHEAGITGKGVKCVYMDQPVIYPFIHEELREQNIEIADFTLPEIYQHPQHHGTSVLANLCGKTIGVAPDVEVRYYFNIPRFEKFEGNEKRNEECYQYELKVLKDIIKRLEIGEKFAVLGISGSPLNFLSHVPDEEFFKAEKEVNALFNKIREFGCEVLDAYRYHEDFCYCDAPMFDDINNINNFKYSAWIKPNKVTAQVCVVCGGKVVPEHLEETGYKYEPDSCASWSIPQVAGLYCLAKQVNQNITLDDFTKISYETASVNNSGIKIFNPQKLIEVIKQNSNQKEK